jgi:outer membrane protein OmpA-like peptidoglycan-associated protein
MGEILLNSEGEGKLNVTTELQSFGMIVTAEPYFAVSQPSDVVVMENTIRPDTTGKIEIVEAKYELLKRGSYAFNADQSTLRSMTPQSATPLYLWEARNAVQIARWAGADKHAGDTFRKAESQLRQAEDYYARKQDKPMSMIARESVQTAEDARLIALQRIEEARLAAERQAAADREADARAKAEEANRKAEEAARQKQIEAERRAAAEADRLAAERERLAAERAKADAEVARAQALAQQQQLAQEADRARQAAADAERARLNAEAEQQKMRQQLLQQFNSILETRETARGLIVNMSDVLFDTAKWTLKPGAREKLAKISGIILAHPGLKIEVEGHTDSVGSDEYNQNLSEQRASSVRDYLAAQGVSTAKLTARGFGETKPVASNDHAAGRQQNRRVELVVSGGIIGTEVSRMTTTTTSQQ